MPSLTDKPALKIQESTDATSESLPKSTARKRHRHPNTKRNRIVRTLATKPEMTRGSVDTLKTLNKDVNIPEASSSIISADSNLPHTDTPKHALKPKEIERYNVRERLRSKLDSLDKLQAVSLPTSLIKTEDARHVREIDIHQQSKVLSTIDEHFAVTQPRRLDTQEERSPESHAICEEQMQVLPLADGVSSAANRQFSTPKKGEPLFTHEGEGVSKTQRQKPTAKSRENVSECEDVLAFASDSVDSAGQQQSLLPSLDSHENSLAHLPISFLPSDNGSVLSGREQHDVNMRTKGSSGRGRSYGRLSSSQVPPDGTGLTFHVSPTPSAVSGRRTRGFQPSEVNKGKQDAKQDQGPLAKVPSTGTPNPTEVSTNLQTSKNTDSLNKSTAVNTCTPSDDSISQLEVQLHKDSISYSQVQLHKGTTSHPQAQLHYDESINYKSHTPAQLATNEMSHPEHDAVDTGTACKPNVSEGSPVQFVTQGRQPSCWSKTAPSLATTLGWDNGTTDLNTPSWVLRDAQLAELPNAPKRANLANLPEYRFPGSGRKKPATQKTETPASSFDRQVASRGRSEAPPVLPQVTDSLLEWGSNQMHSVPLLQAKPQAQVSSKTQAAEAKTNKAFEQALLEHRAMEPVAHIKYESKMTLPDLKAPDSPLKPTAKADTNLVQEAAKAPPHLRISVISSSSDAQTKTIKGDLMSKPIIPAMQDYTLLPHQRQDTGESGPITVSASHQGASGNQPTTNVAGKVVAVLPVPEEKAYVALQAKLSDEKAQPTKPESYGVTKPLIGKEIFVPPHLRGQYSAPTPAAEVKTSTKEAKPEVDYSTGPESITTNVTHGNALKGFTQLRQNGKAGVSSSGSTFARGSESAVKAGKKPATNGFPFSHESGLVGWDGKMGAPPIGDDWDYRQRYDPNSWERFSVIEAWREDQATDPGAKSLRLDTNSPNFQTGSGLAGGMQTFMSPIDEVHHETIPNDDDFTQARREQNAAAAVEAMKAKESADSTSLKSGKDKVRARKERMKFLKERDSSSAGILSPYAPEANIYLRPAEHKDMRQCADIYNYYVQETDSAPEFKPVDELHWRDRLQEVHDEGNPFIVAIHLGQKRGKAAQNIRRKKQETVVGFAAATDYGLQRTCYRFTKEMDLWVHKDHVRQGIGRTILDRMLAALDPGYNLLECVPFLGNYALDRWVGGGHCITKAIVINILHSDAEKSDVEWKKKWLSGDRINFQHAGSLSRIGHNKDRKPVNICQMLLETMSTV
ncbi:hypothetical protein N7G274_008657 [Stereocaulon virgatum]|uniref:N-acetyltransferase domain-containing protein n=1 Tax=Stereocaulon virgatum TaxID=373712 RepID=A0ABR3ZY44_9LECA